MQGQRDFLTTALFTRAMDRLVLKKRLASVLSQRKTTIGEEKIESSANDFAENCMKYYKSIILL
jgi:hypothetical protein